MYQPVIEEDKCSNCRECANICPKAVFSIDEDRVRVSDPYHCTGCDSCVAVCPLDAIEVREI
jgi:DNA-directed RNA polymerase subunit D